MAPPQTRLSELPLESRLHRPADAFQSRHAFSPDTRPRNSEYEYLGVEC